MRAGFALFTANVRYWSTIAPQVRRELRRWSTRASAIPDRSLRELAVEKLAREHFNAEVAATLATLVAKEHRERVVEAIVAFEVMYDFLDGLTERPVHEPIESGTHLYRAFTDVFVERPGEPHGQPTVAEDGGYLAELSSTVREAIATLPASSVIADAGNRAAVRCAAGQIRVHAASQIGTAQLEEWARQASTRVVGLGWREYLAGSVASVLAVHALIVAGADEGVTKRQADEIDAAYLSIAALSTMLDSLVDYERDLTTGDPWLVRLYGEPELLGEQLANVAGRAVAQSRRLPHSAHHLTTLLGVVAYYTSAPEAQSRQVSPIVERLHSELRPMIIPTLAVMRVWRLAKRARRGIAGQAETGTAR